MAYAGQMVENPVTGERIVFRQTAADTDGVVRQARDDAAARDGAPPRSAQDFAHVLADALDRRRGRLTQRPQREEAVDEALEAPVHDLHTGC